MLSCLEKCRELEVSCPCEDCRLWVASEENFNCVQHVIECGKGCQSEKEMDCRTVAKIIGLSHQGVINTERRAFQKLKGKLKHE